MVIINLFFNKIIETESTKKKKALKFNVPFCQFYNSKRCRRLQAGEELLGPAGRPPRGSRTNPRVPTHEGGGARTVSHKEN